VSARLQRQRAPETPLDYARQDLTRAFADLRLATDSYGSKVLLTPASMSAADTRHRIEEFLRFMHGSRFIGENSELAYARNLNLLIVAWICAMKFEAEVKKNEFRPT
jgi:hypothetical protein